MSDTQRIDMGNLDWVVMEDGDGNVWIRPSIAWKDAEVYETLRDGQEEIYGVLERSGKL